MHLADLFDSDRRVVGLGRSGEERSEANVVGTFRDGVRRLREAVSRFPDPAIAAYDCPRGGDREVVLAEVQTFQRHIPRDFGMIVDDQRHTRAEQRIQAGQEASDDA